MKNSAGLLQRIRERDRSAASELTGVFLCRGKNIDVEIEVGVPVSVSPGKDSAVRIPYSDNRAETLLRTEAKQLPKEYPGIVLVDIRRLPSAFNTWEALLRRRLQPSVHPRVGAVGLFMDQVVPTPGGMVTQTEVRTIVNDHATRTPPLWLVERLASMSGAFAHGAAQPVRPLEPNL